MDKNYEYQSAILTDYCMKVPEHWSIAKLKRFFSVSSGEFVTPEDVVDTGFPIYGGNGIRGFSANSNCRGRTLLIGRVGANCGNAQIADGDFWYSEHALRVFPIKSFSLDYFRYLVEIIDLNAFANRTAQPLINTKITIDRYAAIPPLFEQQHIASYLDASCAAIDAAVAAKRKQLETLNALRKATIQRIVTRGLVEHPKLKQTGNSWLEEIPAGWDLKMLKRVCEIQTGLTLGKTYEGPLIERPYLRVANVQDGYLALDDVSMIEVPSAVAERVTLRAGDVLMTEGGDLDKLARGYVWSGEINFCLHQNHIFAVRCFPHKLLPKFLAYVTASQYGRDYFEATGKRTTNLASTNGTKVGTLPIPLPSLNEQKALVGYLDKEIERIKGIQTLCKCKLTP